MPNIESKVKTRSLNGTAVRVDELTLIHPIRGEKNVTLDCAYAFGRSPSVDTVEKFKDAIAQDVELSKKGLVRPCFALMQFIDPKTGECTGPDLQTPQFTEGVKYSPYVLINPDKMTFVSGHQRNIFSFRIKRAEETFFEKLQQKRPRDYARATNRAGVVTPEARKKYAPQILEILNEEHLSTKPRDFNEFKFKYYEMTLRAKGQIHDGSATESLLLLGTQYTNELLVNGHFDLVKANAFLLEHSFSIDRAFLESINVITPEDRTSAYIADKEKIDPQTGRLVVDYGVLPDAMQVRILQKMQAFNEANPKIRTNEAALKALREKWFAQGRKKAAKVAQMPSQAVPTYFVESDVLNPDTGKTERLFFNRYFASITKSQLDKVKPHNKDPKNSKISYYEGHVNMPWPEALVYLGEDYVHSVEIGKASPQLTKDLCNEYKLFRYYFTASNRFGRQLYPVTEETAEIDDKLITLFQALGLEFVPYYRERCGIRSIKPAEENAKKSTDAVTHMEGKLRDFLRLHGGLLKRAPYVRFDMKTDLNDPKCKTEAKYYFLELNGTPADLWENMKSFLRIYAPQSLLRQLEGYLISEAGKMGVPVKNLAELLNLSPAAASPEIQKLQRLAGELRPLINDAELEEKRDDDPEVGRATETLTTLNTYINMRLSEKLQKDNTSLMSTFEFKRREDGHMALRSYGYLRANIAVPFGGLALAISEHFRLIGNPLTIKEGEGESGYTDMVFSKEQMDQLHTFLGTPDLVSALAAHTQWHLTPLTQRRLPDAGPQPAPSATSTLVSALFPVKVAKAAPVPAAGPAPLAAKPAAPVKHGLSLEEKDNRDNDSYLHDAVREGNLVEVAKRLKNPRARQWDLNRWNTQGRTPLLEAIWAWRNANDNKKEQLIAIVNLLLKTGADYNTPLGTDGGIAGVRPLNLAQALRADDIIRVMEEHQADAEGYRRRYDQKLTLGDDNLKFGDFQRLMDTPTKISEDRIVQQVLGGGISFNFYATDTVERILKERPQYGAVLLDSRPGTRHVRDSLLHWAIEHYGLENTTLQHVQLLLNHLAERNELGDILQKQSGKKGSPTPIDKAFKIADAQKRELVLNTIIQRVAGISGQETVYALIRRTAETLRDPAERRRILAAIQDAKKGVVAKGPFSAPSAATPAPGQAGPARGDISKITTLEEAKSALEKMMNSGVAYNPEIVLALIQQFPKLAATRLYADRYSNGIYLLHHVMRIYQWGEVDLPQVKNILAILHAQNQLDWCLQGFDDRGLGTPLSSHWLGENKTQVAAVQRLIDEVWRGPAAAPAPVSSASYASSPVRFHAPPRLTPEERLGRAIGPHSYNQREVEAVLAEHPSLIGTILTSTNADGLPHQDGNTLLHSAIRHYNAYSISLEHIGDLLDIARQQNKLGACSDIRNGQGHTFLDEANAVPDLHLRNELLELIESKIVPSSHRSPCRVS